MNKLEEAFWRGFQKRAEEKEIVDSIPGIDWLSADRPDIKYVPSKNKVISPVKPEEKDSIPPIEFLEGNPIAKMLGKKQGEEMPTMKTEKPSSKFFELLKTLGEGAEILSKVDKQEVLHTNMDGQALGVGKDLRGALR